MFPVFCSGVLLNLQQDLELIEQRNIINDLGGVYTLEGRQ